MFEYKKKILAETSKIARAKMKGYFLSLTGYHRHMLSFCELLGEKEFKQLARIEIHRDFGLETERDGNIQSKRDDGIQSN